MPKQKIVRFCIFSDPALENIGIPTNKEVVEMQTNTATALADKLAAVNKKYRLCPERGSAVDKVTGKHTYKTFANVRYSADQFKALDSVRN
ncbi:hypothetical protein HBH43_107570 [Parastagonospora nodorum]|nr:hypothetical protein HBH43_107570 [Parastagonospora nodorum]